MLHVHAFGSVENFIWDDNKKVPNWPSDLCHEIGGPIIMWHYMDLILGMGSLLVQAGVLANSSLLAVVSTISFSIWICTRPWKETSPMNTPKVVYQLITWAKLKGRPCIHGYEFSLHPIRTCFARRASWTAFHLSSVSMGRACKCLFSSQRSTDHRMLAMSSYGSMGSTSNFKWSGQVWPAPNSFHTSKSGLAIWPCGQVL